MILSKKPRSVRPERSTHEHDGDLVVFLIGMSIRKFWRPDVWLPIFIEMPRMLRELMSEPGSGLLGYRLVFDPRGPWLVQYWDSVDKLYDYASRPDAEHRPAWTRYNRRARQHPTTVGVWHETFQVARAESIYVGMPPAGLAAATRAVPVAAARDRARDRMANG